MGEYSYDADYDYDMMKGMSMTSETDGTSGDAPAPAPPVPKVQGSFALYEHNGGYIIAWKKRGETETRRLAVPAFVIGMAAQAAGRTPEEVINELMGAST